MSLIIALVLASPMKAPTAEEVFGQCERKLKAAQSLSGRLEGPFPSAFLMQKPASFRVINGQVNIYCNGSIQFNHLVEEKEWFSRKVDKGGGFGTPYILEGFYGGKTGDDAPYFVIATKFRMQQVDGRKLAAKALHFESFGRDDRMVFYVDPKTGLPVGWDQVFGYTKTRYNIVDLKLNVPVPAGAFDWKPTPDLKERKSRPRPPSLACKHAEKWPSEFGAEELD